MRLWCVGCNWQTPVGLRERLALDPAGVSALLASAKEKLGVEAAALSTCNRTELYLGGGELPPEDVPALGLTLLAEARGVPLAELEQHAYRHHGDAAARHWFVVASGLDSLILGEGQVLGQTKAAYDAATAAGAAGPLFHPLFQRAFAAAKRVRTETPLAEGRLSIASAAVDFIREVFDDLRGKTALMIGAGKMAELTLTHLQPLAPKRILVANRGADRAQALAAKFGGEFRPFETLADALVEADVVVSGTGAGAAIFDDAAFAEVHRRRRGRHMAIVDIAVPRDFDPAIGQRDNVFLWNIDHLEHVRTRTLQRRQKAVEHALRIVDEELAGFKEGLRAAAGGATLADVERRLQETIDAELAWLLPQLNGMPDADREKIKAFAHRLKNKFLHPPRAALRAEAKDGDPGALLAALRKLFHLE